MDDIIEIQGKFYNYYYDKKGWEAYFRVRNSDGSTQVEKTVLSMGRNFSDLEFKELVTEYEQQFKDMEGAGW